VVNPLETQFPSPVFPATAYYTAYGVVNRGFPLLNAPTDSPEALELMKRATIVPSREMILFGPRITIFTKDGRSYTRQATGREFIWDFAEEVRRMRGITGGLPVPASQYDEIIAMCRDLHQQNRAESLVELTLQNRTD